MTRELTLVKLGGSLITDKSMPYTARYDVLYRLAREIREAGYDNLIIGHGGGSFPHQSAHKYQTHKGIIDEKSHKGLSVVQNDAAKLNLIVVETLIENNINAMSVQPSSIAICENGIIKKWDIEPITRMLEMKMLPIPYGDVALDVKRGCCIISTETILSYLAVRMKAKRIIIAGKVDGVFSGFSERGIKAELIREITPENYDEIKKHLAGSDSVDVTGGMLHKIEKMMELTMHGITTEIINGEKPDYLKRALEGETGLGTVIRP